jgi:hypothetical protein
MLMYVDTSAWGQFTLPPWLAYQSINFLEAMETKGWRVFSWMGL